MFKIRHIPTGKYLSHSGHRYRSIFRYYSAGHWIAKSGKAWSTRKGTEDTMQRLEIIYPGQFEVVEFEEKL
jgi:hypothetical protein